MNNFWTRTFSGIAFIAILIGCVITGAYTFMLVFFVISLLSLIEFYRLVKNYNIQPLQVLGIITGCILFLANAISHLFITEWNLFLLVLPLIYLILIVELYQKSEKPFLNIAVTITGIIYAVVPFVLVTEIAFLKFNQYSWHIVSGILFLQWTSDVGQYLAGIKFGKHPLFARISPKKSWEGFIGGFIFSIAVAYIISKYYIEFTALQWIIISMIIVVFGSFGDLVESLLKRSVNVKDSGTIMPGHGGALDRFDAFIGAMPFVFFYLKLFCRM